MVAFFYILALLAVVLSVIQAAPVSRTPLPRFARAPNRTDLIRYALLCAGLCAAFALQTAVTDRAVLSQAPLPDWFRRLPFLYFAPYPPIGASQNASLIVWAQFLAVTESAILLGMYFVLRDVDCRRRTFATVTLAAAAILAAVAFRSVTTDVDSYLYIGHALVWPHEYATPSIAFGSEDASINRMWGTPLLPSAYGPLWNAFAKIALGSAASLRQQSIVIRLMGLASIVACALCVWRLRGASIVTLLFVLNPAIYVRYLVRAHNDLTGVALILAAGIVRRHVWAAMLLVAAAGTAKLPLLLGGLVVFWDRPTLVGRLVPALGAALLSLGASLVLGGTDYFTAFKTVYDLYNHHPSIVEQAFHVLLADVAVAAVALALTRQRFIFGADWSFVALGQFPLAHYLGWCVPYVILGSASAIPFLVSWPALDETLTFEYPYTPFFLLEGSLAVVGLAVAIRVAIFLRRSSRVASR